MTSYLYVAWFRDTSMLPDDQDYEWPACIWILATSDTGAIMWGDHLGMRYAARKPTQLFLGSYLDLDTEFDSQGDTPVVRFGEYASNEVIGW